MTIVGFLEVSIIRIRKEYSYISPSFSILTGKKLKTTGGIRTFLLNGRKQILGFHSNQMAPGVRGKPLAWGADRVEDKSSLDVLLDWLEVEGNYNRWAQAGQQAKEALSYEVVSVLEGHGIRHRSFRGVWRKIDDMVKNVDLANRLLARNGLEGAVSLEGCGPLLRAEIQRRWPYYELLAPLMSAVAVGAAQQVETQQEASSQDAEPEREGEGSLHLDELSERPVEQLRRQDEQFQRQESLDEPFKSQEEHVVTHEEKHPSNQEQPEQAERFDDQRESRDPENSREDESHEDSHESNAIFMLANLVNQKNTGEEISNVQDADDHPERERRPIRSPAKRKESDDEDYVPEAGKGLPRWGSDHVNGKSSLDLLIVWLTTADNYARWKAARPKSPMSKESLCSEIGAMMKKHGIYHRKNIDIRKKVWSVEESFAVANQLLIARDIEDLDDCDPVLSAKVLRHCPQYEQLAPFMSAKHGGIGRREKRQYRSRKRKQQDMEEQTNKRARQDPDEQHVETVDAENESSVSDPVSSDPIEQEVPHSTARVPTPDPVVELSKLNLHQHKRLNEVHASFQLGHDRNVVDHETMREKSKMELEALRVQNECELETEQRKQKLQLETIRLKSELELEKAKFALQVTRERNEYALVVERALSRQKLMSAGLSQTEVDRILPSKIAVTENLF